MANFYIEKLVVSGAGKETSIIEFKEGLNFIIGPSNTGKTTVINCIDYLLGFTEKQGKPFDFDKTSGYDHFSLTVQTKDGTVVFERKLDEKQVKISGTNPNFEHKDYSLTHSAKWALNSVWLRLMGIGDEHKILGTLTGKLHQLTVRAMIHMFLVKQEEIARTSSVLLNPKTYFNDTASKAILLFLMSGRDAEKKDTPEEKKIRKAKRLAVVEYIQDSVKRLVQREGELLKIQDESAIDLNDAINVVKNEIDALQAEMNFALSKSRNLMDEIYKRNSKLAECETISQRFSALRSQYHSDVERLTFIIEGRTNQEGLPINTQCPFCDGKITNDTDISYVEAAGAELSHIRVHLVELQKAENDVATEYTVVQNDVTRLEAEKREVDALISGNLVPRINALHGRLNNYRQAVELSKELTIIQQEEIRLSNEATAMETAKDAPDEKHDIIQYFDEEQLFAFNERLRVVLESCKYEGFASARLSLRDTFDLEVGGKAKSMIAGGGYSGFLNTIVALSLVEFLEEKGSYSPGFLIADSPLSQLSEPENHSQLHNKKAGFFNYLLSKSKTSESEAFQTQIIIAEHPEKLPFSLADYPHANVIEFTSIEGEGRYGFLEDVRNDDNA